MGDEDGAATGSDGQAPRNHEDPPASDRADGDDGQEGGSPADFPPERYRGLQRQLSAAERRAQDAETQRQQLEERLANSADSDILRSVMAELQQADPDRAVSVAGQVENQQLRRRLEALEARENQDRIQSYIRETIERNNEELREVAKALGADPDHTKIDYGADDEAINLRMRKVRESVLALRPRNPSKPRDSEGNEVGRDGAGTHNIQPAQRPPADKGPKHFTDAEITAQRMKFGRTRSAEDRAKLMEMVTAATA